MAAENQAVDAAEKGDPERTKAVRDFFIQLRKGVKTIGMYRHTPARFPEYLRPAFSLLEGLLAAGPLTLRVGSESFDFGEEPVWAAEPGGDNLPGRFFREGVRHLMLRPELTEAELTQLVMIMLSNPERGGADIVTQLMNASFAHIEYVVVEGFTVGELSEEQVEVAVDSIVQYLYGRLRGSSDDTLAYARVSANDLELKLDNVEQIRGAVFDGDDLSESFKQGVQQELMKDETTRLHFQLAQLIFWELREGRAGDLGTVIDVFTQLIDGMLLREELSKMPGLLEQLAGLDSGPASQAGQVLAGLGARMSEEHRLRRLGDGLKLNPAYDVAAARCYLARLGPEAVPPLLDVLEGIQQPERRGVLVDALAVLGKESPQFFAARLNSEKSQTVRDMIAIIDKANFADRAKHIQTALKNPNPAVRMEVLSILAHSKAVDSVHRFVLDATLDKSPQVRHAAFRSMVSLSPIRATQDLLRLPKLPDWEKRPQAEKELIYECLGQAGTPEVYRHAIALLQQKKSLFAGKKIVESKLLAVLSLQATGSLQAFKILQSVAENKETEADVAAAARKGMLQVRRVMSEAARQTAETGPAAAEEKSASSTEIKASADQLFSDFVHAREDAATEELEYRRRAAELKAQEGRRQALEIQQRQEAEAAPEIDLDLTVEENEAAAPEVELDLGEVAIEAAPAPELELELDLGEVAVAAPADLELELDLVDVAVEPAPLAASAPQQAQPPRPAVPASPQPAPQQAQPPRPAMPASPQPAPQQAQTPRMAVPASTQPPQQQVQAPRPAVPAAAPPAQQAPRPAVPAPSSAPSAQPQAGTGDLEFDPFTDDPSGDQRP